MAPEVHRGHLRPSLPADVFAFGALMWHAYTRLPPLVTTFDGGPSSHLSASISPPGHNDTQRTRRSSSHNYSRPSCQERHPRMGELPESAPLSFALIVLACLSERAAERPSMEGVRAVLHSVARELASGTYRDMSGQEQVRYQHLFYFASVVPHTVSRGRLLSCLCTAGAGFDCGITDGLVCAERACAGARDVQQPPVKRSKSATA